MAGDSSMSTAGAIVASIAGRSFSLIGDSMSKTQDDGALLAASLRFAAALLPPDVTPHVVCTKTALSAIVLASHRLSQHALAQLKLPLAADPRRLLTKLVESDLDDQLAHVSVADITWDSEGVVAQTLEMELCDVEERAGATLQKSICVLICVTSSTTVIKETAVVWLPRRHEDSSNNSDSKNPKYLLFVAPGRVKVVKSLSELMKKMHEEMPALRDRDATYRAWTLIDGTKLKKDVKLVASDPRKAEGDLITRPTTPLKNELQNPKEEKPEQEPVLIKRIDDQLLDDPKTGESAKVKSPSKHLRVRVMKAQPRERETMFAFLQTPLVEPLVEDRGSDRTKTFEPETSATTEKGGLRADEPSAVENHLTPVRQTQQRTYLGLSASHADARSMKDAKLLKMNDASVWQSVDGEIKRTRRDFLDTPPSVKDDLTMGWDTTVADPPVEVVELTSHCEDRGQCTRIRGLRARPFLAERIAQDTIFQFSSTNSLQPPSPQAMHFIPVAQKPAYPESFESLPHRAVEAQSNQDGEERSTIPVLATGDMKVPVKKKRSARDHYRSKLGARVWWELENQATKILQEGVFAAEDRASGTIPAICEMRKANVQPRPDPPTTKAVALELCVVPEKGTTTNLHTRALSSCKTHSVTSPEPDQLNTVTTEPPTDKLKSSTPASIPTQANVLVSSRIAWQDRKSQPESRRNEQAKIEAAHHATHSAASEQAIVDDQKHRVAMASQAVIDGRHNNTVETTLSTVSNRVPSLRQASQGEDGNAIDAKVPVKTEAARMPTVPSPRKQEHFSREDHQSSPHQPSKCSERPQAPSPLSESRKDPGSPISQPKSKRFSVNQSRTRYEDVIEEDDDVLMATMAPRAQSTTPVKPTHPPTQDDKDFAVPLHHTPFNIHGRVPIRRPQHAVKPAVEQHETDEDNEDHESVSEPASPLRPEVSKPKLHLTPPPMATFISVGPVSKLNDKPVRDDDATQRARQQKLAELRQKKLLQLQKARDEALNKKKPSAHQHPTQLHAASVVAHPEGKPVARAVAPPPPASVVDRAEAFPVVTTTRTGHRPSNRQLIQNAIEYTLLAGGSLDKERQAALHALAESTCDNFIVLLKSAKELKFRALYEHHMERGRIVKIYGVVSSAPPVLTEDVINQFFRYNSGKKEFAPIDGRSFTVKTDACALVDQLVFKKKSLHRLL